MNNHSGSIFLLCGFLILLYLSNSGKIKQLKTVLGSNAQSEANAPISPEPLPPTGGGLYGPIGSNSGITSGLSSILTNAGII